MSAKLPFAYQTREEMDLDLTYRLMMAILYLIEPKKSFNPRRPGNIVLGAFKEAGLTPSEVFE